MLTRFKVRLFAPATLSAILSITAIGGCKSPGNHGASLEAAAPSTSSKQSAVVVDLVKKNPIVGRCAFAMSETSSSLLIYNVVNGKADKGFIKIVIAVNEKSVKDSSGDSSGVIDLEAYNYDGDKNLGGLFSGQQWSSVHFEFDAENKKISNVHIKRQKKALVGWSTELDEDC